MAKRPQRRKIARAPLDASRREYEAGDELALNEAYLEWMYSGESFPEWLKKPLGEKLRLELEESPKGALRKKRLERLIARFETCEWFRRQGCGWRESQELAALALDGKRRVGGGSTILHAHNEFKKRLGLAPRKPYEGPEPVPEGFENMTPADLPFGPAGEAVLHEILRKHKHRAEK